MDPDLRDVAMPNIISQVLAQLSSCGLSLSIDAEKPKVVQVKPKA